MVTSRIFPEEDIIQCDSHKKEDKLLTELTTLSKVNDHDVRLLVEVAELV